MKVKTKPTQIQTITVKDYRELIAGIKTPKYHNKKVDTPDGEHFDSQKEYKRWCELSLMEKAGEISDLQRQVKFVLIPKQEGEREVSYIADFVYCKDGERIVEDSKGGRVRTKEYIIKRKMMRYFYNIKIFET